MSRTELFSSIIAVILAVIWVILLTSIVLNFVLKGNQLQKDAAYCRSLNLLDDNITVRYIEEIDKKVCVKTTMKYKRGQHDLGWVETEIIHVFD